MYYHSNPITQKLPLKPPTTQINNLNIKKRNFVREIHVEDEDTIRIPNFLRDIRKIITGDLTIFKKEFVIWNRELYNLNRLG